MIPIARPTIGEEEIRNVVNVLKSGRLTMGKKVKEFERRFAEYVGCKYAIATNNGTSALHVALLSSGIGSEDEVITTSFSFVASSNCILYCGAKPVFVDIDKRTFNIDPKKIEEKVTKKTKAILIVHLFGQPCRMDKIIEIANIHDLLLIEDCAQAHGAKYNNKPVGSFGDVACFSFYPTKNMTTGEGGIIVTNKKNLAKKAEKLRDHGRDKRDNNHTMLGYNYRMTEVQAAIGVTQLDRLEKLISTRIENARYISKGLRGIRGLTLPFIQQNVRHVFNCYTVMVEDNFAISRDSLKNRLNRKGIDSRIYYPVPIYLQPLYQRMTGTNINKKCPIAERISKKVLSLPVHPQLSKQALDKIVQEIRLLAQNHKCDHLEGLKWK
jgi:perosamine synthetase